VVISDGIRDLMMENIRMGYNENSIATERLDSTD
jgi:hypothetical protein